MSRRLEEMRRNPRANWTVANVQAVCEEAGVGCTPPRGCGSHYKVHYPGMSEILTVPFKRPIKPVYIRRLVAFIDSVRKAGG